VVHGGTKREGAGICHLLSIFQNKIRIEEKKKIYQTITIKIML
jgi:hypothetical protein